MPPPAQHRYATKPRPLSRSSAHALLRRTRGERGSPGSDPCLPLSDRRQRPLWRACVIFLVPPVLTVTRPCVKTMGTYLWYPNAFTRIPLLGNGTCPLVYDRGWFL